MSAKKEFGRCQRKVKCAVDAAKEEWICRVPGRAEKAKKDGHQRWTCVRQLQMAHQGRRPCRPTALVRDNGEMTTSPEEVRQQWHQHFSRILNVTSEYCQEVIDETPRRPPRLEFDGLEELLTALSKLKQGKAGGKTGILSELLLCGGPELQDRLLQVMQDMWEHGTVVDEWRDAVIVPIPKKGDLKECDNWRGISLLDVAGKLFARVIQERL